MRDCGHCMMPYEGTEEFEAFYDFSRLYRDLPSKVPAICAKQEEEKSKKQKAEAEGEEDGESDDWATEDEESADEIEEADPSDEEDSESFEVISKNKGNTTESFTVISKPGENTKSFEVIEPSESSIAGEDEAAIRSISSHYSGLNAALGKRKGKTRQEAFNALNIEKVELLNTGELRLPSGKIIGHRDYKHIYRQRNRLPDQREAVVINKLAIEYRKMKHGDGTVMVRP